MSSDDLLLDDLVGFGAALRTAGLRVGVEQMEVICRASAGLGPSSVYWVGRCTAVSRQDDISTYDTTFASYWGSLGRDYSPREPRITERVRVTQDGAADGDSDETAGPPAHHASRLEILREKSFAEIEPDEISMLHELMMRMVVSPPLRRTRRRTRARRGDLDLRRTVRRSVRTGGVAIERAWREPRWRPRRVVFLLDVSGSMTAYSRALLLFAHAARRSGSHWEVFCFGTRLTQVTRALTIRDPQAALRAAAATVEDWDGGTRIGASIGRFLTRFGHRGMARGAVVVICSDGLEIDDPAQLEREMVRLNRLAHSIVWLNPLKAGAGYQPLARGMRAALPQVDVFGSGHNLASLDELARALALDAVRLQG
jgi:uncharacterized protein with von Willebrand factor type A (vWA) domain